MNQCVPSWDLDEPHNSSGTLPLHPPPPGSTAAASPPHASSWKKSGTEYEVAELTWVNGLPSMNGLDQICTGKLNPKSPPPPWEKGGGTLESIIDQATGSILLPANPQFPSQPEYDLVPWIAAPHQRRGDEGCSATTVTTTTATAIMDALVPCSMTLVGDEGKRVPDPEGRCKRARAGGEGNCSVRESAASMDLRKDTCEVNGGQDVGFTTSTSPLEESRETEDASCRRPLARAVHERDSASQSRHSKGDGVAGEKKQGAAVRSSVSTKRSRVAAVHNQSERKRRDRINQRMKTLQKLVPNSSKTDKASMLDEVIDYLKRLQAQVQMMSSMTTTMAPPMMMPMPVPMQQLQMAMMAQMIHMAQMRMGLGMAMGVDMNPLARAQPQQPKVNPSPRSAAMLHPPSFIPIPIPAAASWDGGDQQQSTAHGATSSLPANDPSAAFMGCQPQMPMNMDAFNRMAAALYQQLYKQPSQQNPDPNM